MVASLSRQQIRLIKEKIAQEGVSTAELAEDLLDHLCTSVEEEMEHGLCFEKAFEKVFNSLEEDELKLTEMKTQELLEGKKVYYPNIWQSFDLMVALGLGILLLGPVAGYILSKESALPIRRIIAENLPLYIIITNLILFGGVIGYAVLQIRKTQWKASIFSFRPVPLYVYVVVACMFPLIQFWIEPLALLTISPEKMMGIHKSLLQHGLMEVILVISFSSILVELLFRGIILKGLLKTMTPVKAILWSSLFFIAADYTAPFYMFTMGLILGWIYWKTKSLYPTIFMLVFGTTISYCRIFFMTQWREEFLTWKDWFDNLWLYIGVIAVSFMLTVGLFYYLHRKLAEEKQS